MAPINLRESRKLFGRAQGVLPGGVSTAFRRAERPLPLFFDGAAGARLTDVDGNDYIDYVCGFGPVILGHGDPRIGEALTAGLALQQIGGQQRVEAELAQRLCELVPAFEQVRFSVTGSEAVHAAIRLARAATGRKLLLKFAGHYHGWFDGIMTATASSDPGPDTSGQPESALADVRVIDWNDLGQFRAAVEEYGEQLAAVIMEPLPCNQGVIYPAPGYLEEVRRMTREAGVVLIFDEVITGFRVGLGGAQELLGVTPDLAVVAKAMANGLPISAFGGSTALMDLLADNSVIHAGTYNGGGTSLRASLATIDALEENGGAAHLRMQRLGSRLQEGLRSLAEREGQRWVTQGPGSVFFTWFTDSDAITRYGEHQAADFERYALFAELMIESGVRLIPTGRWYLNAAHTDGDIDRTLDAAATVFGRLP